MTSDWPDAVFAGQVEYPPGGTYGPRLQRHHQLVTLHSGSLRLTKDGEVHTFPARTAVWLKPGWNVYFEFAEDEPTRHLWLDYLGVPPLAAAAMLEEFPLSIPLSPRMEYAVREAVRWRSNPQPLHERLCASLAEYALLLYRHEAADAHGMQAARARQVVDRVAQWVEPRLGDSLTLKDLAGSVGLTPEHLCRVFKQAAQPSPMSWLWSLRTRHGLELLRATGLSVDEIAMQCGFKSPFHFSRRVKAEVGASPTEFRRAHLNHSC